MPDLNNEIDSTRPVPTGGADHTKPTKVTPLQPVQSPAVSGDATLPVPVYSAGNETIPVLVPPSSIETGSSSSEPPIPPKKRRIVGRVILLGLLIILLLGALGGWLGYMDGMNSRRSAQSSQVAKEAATQFQLGLQDFNENRLEVAKTRFEYIISLDPNFPGVKEKLGQVLLKMAQLTTPTAEVPPTPTSIPTPSTKNEDEQLRYVLQQMVNKNWDAAINGLDGLRKLNINYKPIDVDGLYFMALRNRGVDKMLKYADLEGGIYDLSLAEKFAAIDRDADGWRTFARLYLTGAAYWEVNWDKAVEYFAQVAPLLPNLRDTSGITAIERYRIAVVKSAEKLINDDEYCKAAALYQSVLSISRNSVMEPTATRLAEQCNPPTKTPTATLQASLTATRTLVRTSTATKPVSVTNTPGGATSTPSPATATPTPGPATATPTPKPPSPTPTK